MTSQILKELTVSLSSLLCLVVLLWGSYTRLLANAAISVSEPVPCMICIGVKLCSTDYSLNIFP